jgi:diacylglycerol kinase family enzyme
MTRAFRVQISCDGVPHQLKSIHLTVANGRHYGRGLTIRDDAGIDDQKLHCYSLEPQSLWELFKSLIISVKIIRRHSRGLSPFRL